MTCLSNFHLQDQEQQQKSRKETTVFHPKEQVIVWILFAFLAIWRLRIASLYDPGALVNRVGNTPFELEQSIASHCYLDIIHHCVAVQRAEPDSIPQQKLPVVRLKIIDDVPCDTPLAPQPFLAVLSKHNRLYQSLDCHPEMENEDGGERDDLMITDTQEQQLKNNMINQEEEQVLQAFNEMISRVVMIEFANYYKHEGRSTHIILDSMLEILTTSEVEREAERREAEPRHRVKVKLFLDDKPVPAGRLNRSELLRRLSDTWRKMPDSQDEEWAGSYDVLGLLKDPLSTVPPSQTLSPLPLSPFHHLSSHRAAAASCVRQLYNQNRLVNRGACPNVLRAAHQKGRELEIRWDCPLAAMVRAIHLIVGVVALYLLSSNVGQGETRKQRRRRHFRQMLRDPLLRKEIERDAIKRFQNDEKAVAKFMEEQDAKAAQMEAADADLEWRRSEARLEAWKQRLRFLRVMRRDLVVALIVSLGLLLVDKPRAGVVLDGAMVVVMTFGLTYVVLPKSPEQQSKKGIESGLEEPLLNSGSEARIV